MPGWLKPNGATVIALARGLYSILPHLFRVLRYASNDLSIDASTGGGMKPRRQYTQVDRLSSLTNHSHHSCIIRCQ